MKTRIVGVELGGEKRRLRFDLGAVELFEQATGRSALTGIQPRTVTEFTSLIWACLGAEDEANDREIQHTRREVRVWLEEDGVLEKLTRQVLDLVGENSPDPEDAVEGADGPPDPPTPAAGSSAPTPSASSTSDSASGSSGG